MRSSDSDSGNCETEKRTYIKTVPISLPQNRKQHQRRPARAVSKNPRNEKRLGSDRPSPKNKVNWTKKNPLSKNCCEQAESDSGQEMYFCFEGYLFKLLQC